MIKINGAEAERNEALLDFDEIKIEEDVKIEYMQPIETQYNDSVISCKNELEFQEDCMTDDDFTLDEYIKTYPVDGISLLPSILSSELLPRLSSELSAIRETKCDICKALGVTTTLNVLQTNTQHPNVCEKCNSKYLPRIDLKNHQPPSPRRRLKCYICKVNTTSPLNGYRSDEQQSNVCEKCKSNYLPRIILKRPRPLPPRRRFECYICEFEANGPINLEKHIKLKHPVKMSNKRLKKVFQCNVDDNEQANMKEMENTKRHSCRQCEYATRHISNLIRHMELHSGVKSLTKFKCGECNKEYTDKRNLRKHKVIHLDDNEKEKLRSMFKCNVCEYSTLWNAHLTQHMKVHVDEKPFACDVCSKRFYYKASLGRHINSHLSDKPFECEPCQKTYKCKASLEYHMEIKHLAATLRKSGKYECFICKYKKCVGLSHLRLHMQSHSDVRAFQCKLCPKSFKTIPTLRNHQKVHDEKRFECKVCFRRVKTKASLHLHIETHLDESQRTKNYKCNLCSKSFKKMYKLVRHQRVHVPKVGPFICEICKREFLKSRALNYHRTLHTSYPFDCHFCTRHFSTDHKRELHENAKHKRAKFGKKTFQCYLCKLVISEHGYSKLKFHMLKHTGELPFQCTICHKAFALKGVLKKHGETHWDEKDKAKLKKFKCQLCGYASGKKSRLDLHLLRHIIKFQCNVCFKDFATEGRLSYHKRAHTGIYRRKYECHVCKLKTAHVTQLRNHMRKHTNEKPFQCNVCQTWFKHKSTRNRHRRMHELNKNDLEKLKKYKCNLCEYSTLNGNNLKRHVFTHTGGEKKFVCNKCPMKFPGKSQLNMHNKTHLDVTQRKQFKCSICNIAFTNSGNLNRHHMTKHKKVKPFACNKCPEKFSERKTLENHLRAHIDTPYFCKKCSRKFSRHTELKDHMKRHRATPFACKLCPAKFTLKSSLKRHITTHDGKSKEKPQITCSQCSKNFSEKSSLKRHLLTHANRPKNVLYECFICKFNANVLYKLKQHLLKH